jgi:nuclear pore complex protein Nup205
MYENSNWHALEILFGLLGCSVPPSLKAHLIDAITQFAKSPSLVNKIWLYLEASQVLQTSVSATGPTKVQEGGIKFELAEIEARNEEYPFVSSFLRLIFQLLKYRIVPSDLGLPYRASGVWPFIDFIREEVFLRYDNRGYKRVGEKWQIASQCLRIFKILLEQYEPSAEDFETRYIESQGKTFAVPKSGGFDLMMMMLQQSNFFKKLTALLEYAIQSYDTEIVEDGGEFFEESVLLCLKIIEIALEKEKQFLSLNTFANSPLLLTPIDQLFLLNRSQIVTIAQFIYYADNPQIPLLSVRILRLLCLRQDKQNKLVNVFLEAEQQKSLIVGYVERLETAEDFSFPDKLEDDEDQNVSGNIDEEQKERAKSVRLAIVELMLSEINRPWPSMVHFLLGYNLQRQITPGLYPDPTDPSHLRTCLHALVDLFSSREFPFRYPVLSEKAMELVYKLCQEPYTHPNVMRYLRTTAIDFFYKQLHRLSTKLEPTHIINQLHFRAWLLKAIALELHVTTSLEQRTATQRLLSLLFNTTIPREPDEEFEETEIEGGLALEQQRMKMRELLDPLYLPLDEPQPLTNSPLLSKVDLSTCTGTDERGIHYIDITRLHKLLLTAQRTAEQELMLTGSPQQDQLKQEIENILKKAVAWNRFYLLYSAMCHLFEGWKQILEVSLHECYEILRMKSGEAILYEMTEVTLRLLNTQKIGATLATTVSQTLLVLISKLRISFLLFNIELSDENEAREKYLPVEQLHTIFRGIVSALINNGTTQPLRGNLYTALLNYLQFTHAASLSVHTFGQQFEKMWLIEEIEAQHRKLILGNMRILEENGGEKLIETLANDATDAIPLWKSIAFGTLDAIVRYDMQGRWLNYICQRGFLRHFLDELSAQTESLISLLNPDANSISLLYVYESKMSLLLRIAQTSRGAEYLIENGIVHTLTQCYFIDRRPHDNPIDYNEWIPSVLERYSQLLLPVLRLLVCLLTSLPKNTDVALKIFQFITEHSELFSSILKDRTLIVTKFSLQELNLVTAIFYRLSYHTAVISGKLEGRWIKYQNQMLNLLSKYCIKERWSSRTMSQTPGAKTATKMRKGSDESEVEDEVEKLVRNICTNIISYIRVLVDLPKGLCLCLRYYYCSNFQYLLKKY